MTRRGALLLELSVAMVTIALVLGLLVSLVIHFQRSADRMQAQARCVAAAREASALVRRDVQECSSAAVSTDGLSLRFSDRTVKYAHTAGGWVRRSTRRADAPVWLREEVRSLRFSREGRAVRAEIICAATS